MSPRTRTFVRLATIFVVAFVVSLLIAIPVLQAYGRRGGEDDPTREMDGVVDVNTENYYDVVGHDRYVLLEFYADWCGHCRDFASTYAEYGQYALMRPELTARLIVGKVNSPENRRVERRYKIQGYPTALLIPPHSHTGIEFQHSRDVTRLIEFVDGELAKAAK